MSGKVDSNTALKLYIVRVSPCCRIVWLYALQHNIPCELTDVDVFNGEHREPKFVAMNPHEEVPMLADGNTTVFGGLAILRYLSQKYTNFAGWGKAPEDRYRVHSVLDWASSKLLNHSCETLRELHGDPKDRFPRISWPSKDTGALFHAVLGYKFVYPQLLERYHLSCEAGTEELVEKGLAQASELLETIENFYLGENPFLCGTELTVADSYVATILCQAECVELDFALWPRLSEWLVRVKSQEHWSEVHSMHTNFAQKLKKVSSIDYE